MLVAVFGDAHAHAEALEAVIAAAEASGARECWSLGDMVGGGPDPERALALTRERCTVALAGNHDYGATGSVDPLRLGEPGSAAHRSIELACARLSDADIQWLRSRKPAARREGVQCWHGSPRNPVWEFVGPANAAACLAIQRAPLGLIGHTHVAGAWQATPRRGARRVRVRPGLPLDISTGKWLLNPGAVGAPAPSPLGWWDALDAQAADGASGCCSSGADGPPRGGARHMTPAPARGRARALGIDDAAPPPCPGPRKTHGALSSDRHQRHAQRRD